ncbi:HlyD family secretion protein [Geomonas subterranea]|uniref:HlyD family efflux transporter periplasmic adaptor subunit n=1 Tax=Geomonas subterranea TaxID=2847989 RepID=A0ABX8LN96_9BACT|nr:MULTISPECIES: HlyD family efflux transporter periplasmic adaptor subunit [Geomonas]QXE91794.1 HlyD family efflux transporter periplasmic adaptor subunit [Geomonas subterranea]QXM10113.1 HlyD family efflux transporter periplasmic adaptor subunit [Geomonas subterranea]
MRGVGNRRILIAAAVVLMLLGLILWQQFGRRNVDDGIVSGNGRIEAVEIDVGPKSPGRVREILVREGDFVRSGETVALMDSEVLEAQHREAQAQLVKARNAVLTSKSEMTQRASEKAAAQAVVAQREAELALAGKRVTRSTTLAREGATSQQEADDDLARLASARASTAAARAQEAAAEAAVATARQKVLGEVSNVAAVGATVQRIEADMRDARLKSPRDGRVQYRVAQPGEVVAAGGRVLSLVDLSDVYMTFFLPTAAAGRVPLGTEVRIVLDAAPRYVIPARVSFVSDVAQFTPKTVETASEREKLMFRVRAQLPVELLKKHITQVKTGLPGMAYVRLDGNRPWPAHLEKVVR